MEKSVAFDPTAFFVDIELGNLRLKRGAREEALGSYREALRTAPNDEVIRHSIEEQIRRVSAEPVDRVPALRNPIME